MTQLQAYLAQASPFDMPITQVSAKARWQSLAPNHADLVEIISLGVFVCDLAPHAASVERVSCLMGWYHTPVVSSLNTETVAMVVALKAHLQRNVPRWSPAYALQTQYPAATKRGHESVMLCGSECTCTKCLACPACGKYVSESSMPVCLHVATGPCRQVQYQ